METLRRRDYPRTRNLQSLETSPIDIDALRGPKRCPHAASGATRAAAVVNAQKAATMSSWMKTLQSGANKVGGHPRSNQMSRLDDVGVAATARKGCLQQSHELHTAIASYGVLMQPVTCAPRHLRLLDACVNAQTHLI